MPWAMNTGLHLKNGRADYRFANGKTGSGQRFHFSFQLLHRRQIMIGMMPFVDTKGHQHFLRWCTITDTAKGGDNMLAALINPFNRGTRCQTVAVLGTKLIIAADNGPNLSKDLPVIFDQNIIQTFHPNCIRPIHPLQMIDFANIIQLHFTNQITVYQIFRRSADEPGDLRISIFFRFEIDMKNNRADWFFIKAFTRTGILRRQPVSRSIVGSPSIEIQIRPDFLFFRKQQRAFR